MNNLAGLLFFSVLSPCQTSGGVQSVRTDMAGSRFVSEVPLTWQSVGSRTFSADATVLVVNRSKVLQSILGFGSAFTETAGFNYQMLPPTSRAKLVDALWAPPPVGNGFSMGRLHMNSADYSLSSYSLDDVEGDYELKHFDDKLTRDNRYVLPLVRAALKASKNAADFKLFFSPWSPPAWLKKNKNMSNTVYPNGLLPGVDAHRTWANYFVRFARALKAAGVPVWGATLQNEPLVNMSQTVHVYESCAWTAETQSEFLAMVGEALAAEPDPAVRSLQLFGWDWNRKGMADWTKTLMSGRGARYLAGVTHHWYAWKTSLQLADIEALPEGTVSFGAEASLIKHGVVRRLKGKKSNPSTWGAFLDTKGAQTKQAILPDEASVRYTFAVGELYLLDMLGTLRAGSSAWVDWNAFLSYGGGPNHINRTDIGAPVILDAATDSVFLQSPYYYMGHLSRFVRPGARRVACAGTGIAQSAEEHDAVKDYIEPQIQEDGRAPDGLVPVVAGCFMDASRKEVAVVAMNVNQASVEFSLMDEQLGSVTVTLDPHSVRTFTYSFVATATYV